MTQTTMMMVAQIVGDIRPRLRGNSMATKRSPAITVRKSTLAVAGHTR